MKYTILPFGNYADSISQQPPPPASYYVYRICDGVKISTGLMAAVMLGEGCIKTHEKIFQEKAQRYTDMLLDNPIQHSPVMLFYPQQQNICTILHQETVRPADDIKQIDGIEHQIWQIRCSDTVATMSELLKKIDDLYVADGHHRLVATGNLLESERSEPISLLAALFPHTEIDILPYNRGCRDLNGFTSSGFLRCLQEYFDVSPSGCEVRPKRSTEFAMFISDNWYHLQLKASHPDFGILAELAGVDILEAIIFNKILAVEDIENDQRVVFIEGNKTGDIFKSYMNSNQVAVGFVFKPVNVELIMHIADKGERLSPHSTWFIPRLTNGMVYHHVGIRQQTSSTQTTTV
ncbi:hypothetical protein N474_01110 [Pseudoalteromonas luteoviolacea CPMOR-2]|uniref:DUF1015 domain-containing protein n=1 Tax=Pseudoalteromonas luteoviolacea DSM 6061 TaxID=1365250 RepID=A0A166XMQ2_9GAMM|nr:DUF1015 family protein [Pseudoalteromonas luteoviolacea]KZN40573.1 hypothetical protein N475_11515 [Pseudoalteromonas luteoviolacea DSM 6061]KZN55563.1 hypothetical protein N474_01110 [Pseudoalteromonas luteoviolacea CPMOR-2]MBE0389666.1 hypothetical protein [Pseudoalteromonas luteoviolacea DSM 6061]